MSSALGSKEVPTTPLSHQFEAFLDHCIDQNLSLVTLDTYGQVLARLNKWMYEHHPEVTSVSQIEVRHFQRFRRHLREASAAAGKEMSLRTQAKYLAVLRSLLRYYSLEARVPVISRDQIKLPKTQRSERGRELTQEDVERLLVQPDVSKLWGLRDRAIMALLAATGLRVSELCGLNRQALRARKGGTALEITGDRREASVALDSRTASYLQAYLAHRQDDYTPLFIHHKPGKPPDAADTQHRLTRQMVDRMLAKYAHAAALRKAPSARDLARCARL
ncbi:MAG: tyrosine-type recombinase/integrase [Chloroflexi bacterium]|nr:tyrosine-type recombinase/integrase [Chloroflexota bacterium]